jgi:hypothetical protein
VFGTVSISQVDVAVDVLKQHFARDIETSLFAQLVHLIDARLTRPASMVRDVAQLQRLRTPLERLDHLLAIRAQDRGHLSKTVTLGLLGHLLAMDTFVTPHVPKVVREEYAIPYLARRFFGKDYLKQKVTRVRMVRKKTGWISYTDSGPVEQSVLVEEEIDEPIYFRVRRHDFKVMGRRVMKALMDALIPGGRFGPLWRELQERTLVRAAEVGVSREPEAPRWHQRQESR